MERFCEKGGLRDTIIMIYETKQTVNKIEFNLITTIIFCHHSYVPQIKVSEINTQS